jgi:hypothetical protein
VKRRPPGWRVRQTEFATITLNVRAWALVLGLSIPPAAPAEPSVNTQREIELLLRYTEASGCEFYRNGIWYRSQTAQAHLRSKYEYLAALHLINATEDFIATAAAKSSVSGQLYEVRCEGRAPISSSQWLSDVLARIRAVP